MTKESASIPAFGNDEGIRIRIAPFRGYDEGICIWIAAFAGMTKGIRGWIPAFAAMTEGGVILEIPFKFRSMQRV